MRIPFLAIIFLVVYSIATDLTIWRYIKLYTSCSANPALRAKARRYHLICSCLGLLLLIVILCLPRRNPNDSVVPVMWLLYGWLTVYLSKSIWVITAYICLLIKRITRNNRPWHTGLYIALPLAATCFIVLWYGAIFGREKIQVTNLEYSSSRVPIGFNGYRIAQISDLHVGTWGKDTTFVSRLVDSINFQHPDLILFTGDVVNRNSEELRPFIGALKRLHAPDGVWAVLGNHDYGNYQNWPSAKAKQQNMELLYSMMQEMGWRLMNNSHGIIRHNNDSIVVLGVENWGEPPFDGVGDLEKARKNIHGTPFSVLMTHNPEHWRQKVKGHEKIDLSLSGHTHAMQIELKIGDWKWSPAKWIYPNWAGLYVDPDDTDVRLYVNIGCGEVGMPYRIGADPEITMITLKTVPR